MSPDRRRDHRPPTTATNRASPRPDQQRPLAMEGPVDDRVMAGALPWISSPLPIGDSKDLRSLCYPEYSMRPCDES